MFESRERRLWCGVWKAIRREWEGIRGRSRFLVGNEKKVKFWKDMWCEDQMLKEAFPNLFLLAVDKDGWVSDAWKEGGELGYWSICFLRHLNDWEMGEMEPLFRKLHSLVIRRDVKDTLGWRESGNGCFSISSLYRSYTRASSDTFPWCIIWRSWVPVREFFCLGSILK